MTNPRDIIQAEALASYAGDVFRMVCPFCNAKHEQSMRVAVYPDKVVYNCYRAKCTGHIGAIGGRFEGTAKKFFKPKICTEPMDTLHSKLLRVMSRKYGISPQDLALNGVKFLPKTERIYMPTYGQHGGEWGGVAKQWYNKDGPKTVLYRHTDALKLHYATRQSQSDTVIVCEDILSAIKLSHYGQARALLGTYMSEEMAVALAKESKKVIIYLDYDAVDKAFAMKRKYAALGNWEVVISKRDPKDTTHDDLKELLYGEHITGGIIS